jgi:uracil phosphoribosyltransferase
MAKVTLIDHPLIQHKLTLMRKAETSTAKFRVLLKEISLLLAYEVTRDLPLKYELIKTPLAPMNAPVLAPEKKLVLVSIMRAGQGILDGMLELMPSVRVGHVGLYRDPKTLIPVEYYFKVPDDVDKRDMLVVDPMLATGNSAVAAVERLKSTNPMSIRFVCLLAAPEGIERFCAILMCLCIRQRLMTIWMKTVILYPAWEMQAIACLAQSKPIVR